MPSFTRLNRSAATLTKNRTEGSISPFSGMCVTCVDGCIGMCEIGKSAYRGPEVLYPQPFGIITAACEKDYPVDLSHFSIMGTAKGAWGVPADSDQATFEKVSVETKIGHDKGIKLKVPFIISGMGSTNVAKQNWAGIGSGAALSGSILTIGENVCGMDDETEMKNGRVVRSPDMEFRIKSFRDWQHGRLRRRRRPGQRRGHPSRRPGIRHPEARRPDRRAQVGPGGQGHRGRGQDQDRQEGPVP
jgi:hypothetical protein